jgi:uncharacterized phage-like protein YoqJ
MANMTFDDVPGFSVDRNAYRDENDPTTIEEYNIYDDMTHSLDVRRGPALQDPALIDLTAAMAQAHRDRIDADERAAECKRERLREIYGEQTHAAPTQETHDPEKIKQVSNAEILLGQIAEGEKTEKPDVLMITGNRKLKDPEAIRYQISQHIDDERPDIMISGMALGSDTIFAEIAIREGITLHAYIPFEGHDERWSLPQQKHYNAILAKCDKIVIVSKTPSKGAYFMRNAAMVAASDRAIVVWDRKFGGTAHTVRLLERDNMRHTIIENGM